MIDNIEVLEQYELRQKIIEISRRLQKEGLIVRTWGNISAKLDADHFLITPSGVRYEDLTPEMIVPVNMHDLSYEGERKPSSEKAVHAACYLEREDISFIVHTHQTYATCLSILGKGMLHTEYDGVDVVMPCAPYAPNGTQALADQTRDAIRHFPDRNGFLLANHGAVCFGRDGEEAYGAAKALEMVSKHFLEIHCRFNEELLDGDRIIHGFDSHMEEGVICYEQKDTPARVRRIHEEIYAKRPDIRYIVHDRMEAVNIISRRAKVLRPLLEDFVQMIGVQVEIPGKVSMGDHTELVVSKDINAVFSSEDGAYCLGATEEDASTAAILMQKACLAQLTASRYGQAHYLPEKDAKAMNRFYRESYSKLAEQK